MKTEDVFVSMETEKVYFWIHRGQHRKGKQSKVLYAEKSEKFTFPAFRNIQNVKFISLICRKKKMTVVIGNKVHQNVKSLSKLKRMGNRKLNQVCSSFEFEAFLPPLPVV
jgi:hypothetical protein